MGDLASALNTAFDETLNSSGSETTASPAPAEQEAPAKTQEAAPETKPEEPAPDEESGDVLFDKLTPDQIAKLKSTPEGRALHRGLMQSYTAKMQGLSEQAKLWEALNNPETRRQAVEAMARAVGLQIAPTDQPQQEQATRIANKAMEKWGALVGPEAGRQLYEAVRETALEAINGTLEPLQHATDALQWDAHARQSEAQLSQFRALAKERGWKLTPQLEAKMTQLGLEYRPAKAIETVDEGVKYLQGLYRLATADTAESDAEKRVLERMQKAAQSAEPARGVSSVGREKRSNITKEMSLNEAMDVAMREALSEAGLK